MFSPLFFAVWLLCICPMYFLYCQSSLFFPICMHINILLPLPIQKIKKWKIRNSFTKFLQVIHGNSHSEKSSSSSVWRGLKYFLLFSIRSKTWLDYQTNYLFHPLFQILFPNSIYSCFNNNSTVTLDTFIPKLNLTWMSLSILFLHAKNDMILFIDF